MNRPDTHDSSFEVAAPEPFRFAPCLEYLARSSNECLYEIRGNEIRKLVPVGGRNVLISVQNKEDRALNISVLHGGPLTPAEKREAADYVRAWFDLDRELAPFYALARADGVLGALVERFHGLRIMGIPDLFEALCWAILGQQVNLAFAYTLKARVTEAYGDALEWDGTVYRRFPTPEQLLAASPDELGSLKLSRAKSAALLEVARLMAAGELSLEGLLALGDYDLMERRLLAIRGIGPWTAHYVRMRCLGDPSAFPIGDVGLHNAVKTTLGLAEKPAPERFRELFAGWKGWEAYATFYLWRTLY
ncbi:DNA-3-methyladenine glycosylase family protein [Paenibacillus thermotolerans]|uniref:DNA-3-methyladenine glycosylase family protein n=1 Tax=Paenibacillus thermotolerans TaxID=3027807 RepID=UPI0023679D55|nr:MULTISPECIES: DNA-3-methyladenine glycosylase [unclassified Paenibacillus]